MTATPKHEYDATEGTTPSVGVQHEARTLTHQVTNPYPGGLEAQAKELYMMSEIGDGTFVQWATCSKCNKRVVVCACKGGPVEPPSIASWRTTRFDKSFDERPDPSFELLPKIIGWVRDRGYTVTKKGATVEAGGGQIGGPGIVPADAVLKPEPKAEPVEPDKAALIDDGLDLVAERVKAARATESIDPGF